MPEVDINISKLELAASKLRAISHPMRIAIINILSNGAKKSVTEIYRRKQHNHQRQ